MDQMKREHFGTFDLIRLIAALAVIISHSFPLTGTPDPFEIRFGRSVEYIGSLSVGVFFIISGYLITQSWCSRPQPREYLAKRLLRIWPGLAVAVLLSAFAFGLVMTDMPLSEYVTSRASWDYVVHTMLMAPVMFELPGVLRTTPNAAINGSLWTLPYEVLCYLGVFVLGILGALRRVLVAATFVLTLVLVELAVVSDRIQIEQVHGGGLTARQGLPFLCWFLGGATVYFERGRVSWSKGALLIAAAVTTLAAVLGVAPVFFVAGSYLVIAIGRLRSGVAVKLRSFGDPSYGIYLYGFPLQQLVVWGGVRSPWVVIGVTLPAATACGYASWHLVERPVLGLGRSLRAASSSSTRTV